MNINVILDISRKTGIDPRKICKALGQPLPEPSLTNLLSAKIRYEQANPSNEREEHGSMNAWLSVCNSEIADATTLAQAKIAHEYTPDASLLKMESLKKWRSIAAQTIEGCTSAAELQKILFLIPANTEEEFAAIRKMVLLLH